MCVHLLDQSVFSAFLLDSRRGASPRSLPLTILVCFWLPAGKKKVVSFLPCRLLFVPFLPTAFRALLYTVLLFLFCYSRLASLSLLPLSLSLPYIVSHYSLNDNGNVTPYPLAQQQQRFARTTLRTIPSRLKRKTNKNELNRKA